MLKEAHQDVPPELERYAFSSYAGNGGSRYGGSRYGSGGYRGRYGMTGSNNVPIGKAY